MIVLFRWDKSSLSGGQTAYYIEVHKKDIDESILKKLNLDDNERLAGDYIESVNEWATSNPKLAKKNHIYILAAKDGSACQLMEPYFPYSSQWNAYNPLQEFNKEISDLSELASL
jgi:hypothetical protein